MPIMSTDKTSVHVYSAIDRILMY